MFLNLGEVQSLSETQPVSPKVIVWHKGHLYYSLPFKSQTIRRKNPIFSTSIENIQYPYIQSTSPIRCIAAFSNNTVEFILSYVHVGGGGGGTKSPD